MNCLLLLLDLPEREKREPDPSGSRLAGMSGRAAG
jgi:hypothetical protein